MNFSVFTERKFSLFREVGTINSYSASSVLCLLLFENLQLQAQFLISLLLITSNLFKSVEVKLWDRYSMTITYQQDLIQFPEKEIQRNTNTSLYLPSNVCQCYDPTEKSSSI